MGSDIYTAASGAIARMYELNMVANNLANVDTPGFHRDLAIFEVAMQSAARVGNRTVRGAPSRALAGVAGSSPVLGSGPLMETGSALDVAILGPGWFEVETPAGFRYTRAGSFGVDPDGRLVTPDAYAVQGTGGDIRVGASPPEILASGDVVDSTGAVLGTLAVVQFDRPDLLVKEGGNLYRTLPGNLPLPTESIQLAERSIERSNVVAVVELGRLISLQRAFDAAMQVLTQQDQATERLLREVGS